MTSTNLIGLSNWHTSTTYHCSVWLQTNPSAAFVWANNGCCTVFSMVINNHLPRVLSSFSERAQRAKGQTQQYAIEVNCNSFPGRSSCKLVSTYLLKSDVLPAPSAVRNQLTVCDWKAENFIYSVQATVLLTINPHRVQQSKPCYWKKRFEICVLVQIQLYDIMFFAFVFLPGGGGGLRSCWDIHNLVHALILCHEGFLSRNIRWNFNDPWGKTGS